jgi:uncharacterized protein YcbX
MATTHGIPAGRIVSIWRYPIKSMMGEELNRSDITGRGLFGDRAMALVDTQTGKIASAKNPRRWPNLFEFCAAYVEPPRDGHALPPARITLPDGETITTEDLGVEARLSAAVDRPIRLLHSPIEGARAEGYSPDHDWLAQRDEVFEFPLPPGTFFDCATVHLLTTATLDRLRTLSPASRFETRRFRPNLVIQPPEGDSGFVENHWIGRTLTLGDVVLKIESPALRCIMTTLVQGDLPKDPLVLKTAVQHNEGNVGVYASVVRPGCVRRGDSATLS